MKNLLPPSATETSAPVSRRGFIGSSLALAGVASAGVFIPETATALPAPATKPAGRKVISTDSQPIVETSTAKFAAVSAAASTSSKASPTERIQPAQIAS